MYRVCWFCPMLLFCAIFTPDPDERVRERATRNYTLRIEIQRLRQKLIDHGIEVGHG